MLMLECDVPKCGCRAPIPHALGCDGTMRHDELPHGWARIVLFEEVRLKPRKPQIGRTIVEFPMAEPQEIKVQAIDETPSPPVLAKRTYLICDAHELPLVRGAVQKEIDADKFTDFRNLTVPGGAGHLY